MIFYLFRHGQTYFSKYHLRYGNKSDSAEILEESIPKTKEIAKVLKDNGVETIYSSPVKRCVQTVEIIKNEVPTMKIIIDKNLEEEKVTRGLETYDEQTNRIKTFLEEIKSKNLDKVGICSHGWPISVIITLLKNKKVTRFSLIRFPKCGKIIKIDSNQFK